VVPRTLWTNINTRDIFSMIKIVLLLTPILSFFFYFHYSKNLQNSLKSYDCSTLKIFVLGNSLQNIETCEKLKNFSEIKLIGLSFVKNNIQLEAYLRYKNFTSSTLILLDVPKFSFQEIRYFDFFMNQYNPSHTLCSSSLDIFKLLSEKVFLNSEQATLSNVKTIQKPFPKLVGILNNETERYLFELELDNKKNWKVKRFEKEIPTSSSTPDTPPRHIEPTKTLQSHQNQTNRQD